MGLSHAQAVEVAKRLSPARGRVLWFSVDGLLVTPESVAAVVAQHGEVYACRRPAHRRGVEVARIGPEDLRAGAEPGFGVPW